MSANDDRVAQVVAALDALPPGALDGAAAALPGRPGDVLRAVAAALRAPDRQAAVRRVVEADLGGLEALQGLLGPVRADVRGRLARVKADLDRAGRLAGALDGLRRDLGEAVAAAVDAVADDPELAAAARQAQAELDADEAFRAAERAMAAIAAVRETLERATAGAPPEEARLREQATRLEAEAAAVQRTTEGLHRRLLPAVARLAEVTRSRNHPAAADLAAVEAGLAEQAAGPADADVRQRWRRALDLALATGNLGVAWSAGKRVQAEAIQGEDLRLAAVVAHRVADLAGTRGDVARELIARMEEALLLVRLPAFIEKGRAMCGDALARAEEAAPPARARVLLMAGQLSERVGDDTEARKLFRRVMRLAKDDPSFPAELGRAALHLGRLEARAGQPAQARKDLRLAHDIGAGRGDVVLYTEAVPSLVEALVEAGADAEAGEVVRGARDRLAPMGMADGFRADLEERWGRERVAGWLR